MGGFVLPLRVTVGQLADVSALRARRFAEVGNIAIQSMCMRALMRSLTLRNRDAAPEPPSILGELGIAKGVMYAAINGVNRLRFRLHLADTGGLAHFPTRMVLLAQMNYVRVKTVEVVAHGTVSWTELTANGTGLAFATAVGIMGFIERVYTDVWT